MYFKTYAEKRCPLRWMQPCLLALVLLLLLGGLFLLGLLGWLGGRLLSLLGRSRIGAAIGLVFLHRLVVLLLHFDGLLLPLLRKVAKMPSN